MASESLRKTSPLRSPSPRLQLPNGKEVSEILQQMCGEISQSTTAEIVETANSADSESKLRDLMPIYFYSWQLRSPEAVITHLLLHYFILWRDCSELRRDRQVFEEHIEWLKGRVGELEEVREPDPEIIRLTKQVQDLKMKNEKLQSAHNEVSVAVCPSPSNCRLVRSKARALQNVFFFIFGACFLILFFQREKYRVILYEKFKT